MEGHPSFELLLLQGTGHHPSIRANRQPNVPIAIRPIHRCSCRVKAIHDHCVRVSKAIPVAYRDHRDPRSRSVQ